MGKFPLTIQGLVVKNEEELAKVEFTKLGHRIRSEEEWLKQFITILTEYPKDVAITARQMWYRMISHPYNYLINHASIYTNMDGKLTLLRKKGLIDWRRIEDRSRHEISGEDYDSPAPDEYVAQMIKGMEKFYKKDVWTTQKYIIEIWIEKDTLVGIVSKIALKYRVLTFPAGGQTSFTKIKEGAVRIVKHPNKKKKILYLGDWDGHGDLINKRLERDINLYSESGIKIEWDYMGIKPEQAKRLDLVPNILKDDIKGKGKKIERDFEAKYGTDKWEVDALPMSELEKLVKKNILKCIDNNKAWNARIKEQKADRDYIAGLTDEIIDRFDLPNPEGKGGNQMEDEILVDLTVSDLKFLIKSLEEFKGSKKYLGYTQKKKDDFDKLIKKLKEEVKNEIID